MELLHWGRQYDEPPNRMGQTLSTLIGASERMDVLTGYFYFNGVPELAEALEAKAISGKPFHIRILVGMEAEIGTRAFAREIMECEPRANETETQRKARYAQSLLEILRTTPASEKTNADARLYNLFVKMLTDRILKLEIKQTRQANHGKLYLFHAEDTAQSCPCAYLLGSSNFSKWGLKERHELNIRVERDAERARLLADLYQALWYDGSDEIIEVKPKTGSPEEAPPVVTPEVLSAASPYLRPTPFEAYMALMKRYLGESALDADLDRAFKNALSAAGYNPFQYQLKGASEAIKILRHHGGVIIADAVGLGKSVTASLMATQAHPGGGVIIVPATLVEEWKTEYFEKFKLDSPGRPWSVFSMTDLAAAEGFCNRNAVGMVIVDEAHRFRNPKIKDYATLRRICENRRVVLLTATPFNNAPSDLAALVDLFEARSEKLPENAAVTVYDHIIEQDKKYRELVFLQRNWNRVSRPPTVQKQFETLMENKYCNFNFQGKDDITGELKRIGDELLEKLRPYIVRRNRADLRKNDEYFEGGKPMTMPAQKVHGKYYSLPQAQRNAYLAVLNVFQFSSDDNYDPEKGFACTIYRVEEFADVEEDVGNYLDNYRGMTLRHLLRRFDSSPYAFKRSGEELVRRHEEALNDLNDPEKLYFNPKGLDLDENDNEDDEDSDGDMADRLYCRPGSKFKGQSFKRGRDKDFIKGLEADLAVLKKMLEYARTLMRDDSKLALLKELITPSVKLCKGQRDPLLDQGEEAPEISNLPDGAPRRVVIFTMFIDTARHLAQELSKAYGEGIVMLAVDKTDGEEAPLDLDLVKTVHTSDEVKAVFDVKSDNSNVWTAQRILITTDKFSEGVNLNRAGLLVNYDIPWNPVRVIQRLGRINRINSCWFEKIHVYNLYPENRLPKAKSRKSPDWASPQEIAAQKLILIHKLFFEDATILGDARAGTELAFERLDEAAGRDSETESEETMVRKRYREALEKFGYGESQTRTAFEKRLLDYGSGMKTVRLAQPEANMLIFKQTGARIKAELLDDLHTTDMDKRARPIGFLEALDAIASTPDDRHPTPDMFPDDYEKIEQRMATPPARVSVTIPERKRISMPEKAPDVIDAWKKRNDLDDLLEPLIRLRDICYRRILPPDRIVKAGPKANRKQVQAILKAALSYEGHTADRIPVNIEVSHNENILTFANETKESRPCPRQVK